ncbi:MAG: cytidine deaminase [Planctomycetales bacterium]
MSVEIRELIAAARKVQGDFRLTEDLTAGGVGAALLTRSGNIFTGICLDLTCGLGMCAERAAAAEMLKSRETEVILMVAVGDTQILMPCGCCREILLQIDPRNLETGIIVGEDKIVPLRTLIPDHWLAR